MKQVKLLRARGSAELGKVASGSATQGFWLQDRKVGSQVIGKNQIRFPGEEQFGKLGEEEEPETERRRE